MPMLAVMLSSWLPMTKGVLNSPRIFCAMLAALVLLLPSSDYYKLITAIAADGGSLLHGVLQALGDAFDQVIAGCMSQPFVDGFKVVQVDQKQGGFCFVFQGAL